MKILARNFRCPAGEVDIIALDRSTRRRTGAETIAFVEVKTRSSNEYTEPFSAVNADKQRRLRKVARYYLRGRNAGQYNSRFDVVSIVVRDAEQPEIRYIPQAF
jgi:putative endonuclease